MEFGIEINWEAMSMGERIIISNVCHRYYRQRIAAHVSCIYHFCHKPLSGSPGHEMLFEETEVQRKEKGVKEVLKCGKASHSFSWGLPYWLLVYVPDTLHQHEV